MDNMPSVESDVTDYAPALESVAEISPTAVSASQRVNVGIDSLDRTLGGGIPSGSVVALECPSGSTGEEIAYTFAGQSAHSTLYLSLLRRPDCIESDIDRLGDSSSTHIVYLGEQIGRADSGNWLLRLAEQHEPWAGGAVVLDSYTDYELASRASTPALARLCEVVREQNGILLIIVHSNIKRGKTTATRHVKQLADIVFEYSPPKPGGESDQLSIPKMRDRTNEQSELPITLELTIGETLGLSRDDTF
jgi:KaiC/GvpD/RAD55 family RecA-like ATPase